MTSTLIHTFEELPLVLSGGFEVAPVSGQAEIEYSDYDGQFTVREIWLDGVREKTPEERKAEPGFFKRGLIRLDITEHQWLWCAIAERLEGSPQVNRAIDNERLSEGAYHDYRRSMEVAR